MKRKILVNGLVLILALAVLLSAGLGAAFPPRLHAQTVSQSSPLPDLQSLLNFPNDVQIQDLEGVAAEQTLQTLVARPEAVQLRLALGQAGYIADLGGARALQVTLDNGLGEQRIIQMAIVPTTVGQRIFLPLIMKNYTAGAIRLAPPEWDEEIAQQRSPEDSVAYLVAMVADDGSSFFQAHLTNLDPALAQLSAPPIEVNGMPYYYITTLHIVGGRIIYWRYWRSLVHHHPNWFYAYYLHYWDYYLYGLYDWPWWYHWAYGWYYWRFWNYWSAWFPW
ncbi:MAG: hypothetical protein P8129_21245 [Anaerolineae bacterium]